MQSFVFSSFFMPPDSRRALISFSLTHTEIISWSHNQFVHCGLYFAWRVWKSPSPIFWHAWCVYYFGGQQVGKGNPCKSWRRSPVTFVSRCTKFTHLFPECEPKSRESLSPTLALAAKWEAKRRVASCQAQSAAQWLLTRWLPINPSLPRLAACRHSVGRTRPTGSVFQLKL